MKGSGIPPIRPVAPVVTRPVLDAAIVSKNPYHHNQTPIKTTVFLFTWNVIKFNGSLSSSAKDTWEVVAIGDTNFQQFATYRTLI